MARKKKILIVDDDSTISKALSECFSRKGFDVITESRADKALSAMRVQKVDGAIIDCMIPGMNGVDLAKKLREDLSFQDKIVLISGIFKDKNFAKSSIKKSAATDFLFKPLDLEDLLSIFSEDSSLSGDEEINWLKSIAKGAEGLTELKDLVELNVLSIPVLFSSLKSNKANAEVIFKAGKNKYSFRFSLGEIVFCNSSNKNSFVKEEALKSNFTTESQLDEFAGKSEDLILELIEKSMLSPHLKNQIESKTCTQILSNLLLSNQGSIECNISLCEIADKISPIEILNRELLNLDLVKNKVNPLYLQLYFSQLSLFNIKLNSSYRENKSLQSIPLITENSEIISSLMEFTSVSKLLNEKVDLKTKKIIYFLQICGCLDYAEPELSQDEIPKLEQRFKAMLKGIKGKLPEEIFLFLGVEDTRAIFISTFFKSFAKMNHPDRLPRSSPESLQKVNQQVFSIISEAHGILVDPEKKKAYLDEQKDKKAESILKAEALKERGQDLLKKSDYAGGLEYFKKARKLSPDSTNTLYYYWCFMKVNKKIESKTTLVDIYNELVAFPIEDKRNELYSLVLGIFYKRSRKYEDSTDEFKKALGYNENFLPARRELMTLQTRLRELKNKSETNIFNSDLGTVVSNIFKKKAN